MTKSKDGGQDKPRTVSLKALAEHLKLSPATVSLVINRSKAAASIPEETQRRVFAGAKELNYRPNFFARSLRVKRTYTIGVITEEIGDPYGGMVISGIEQYLRQRDFFFLAVALNAQI